MTGSPVSVKKSRRLFQGVFESTSGTYRTRRLRMALGCACFMEMIHLFVASMNVVTVITSRLALQARIVQQEPAWVYDEKRFSSDDELLQVIQREGSTPSFQIYR